MGSIKEVQEKYRPDPPIKVLFVGESLPIGGKYFYCGRNSLLTHFKRALGEEGSADEDFFEKFKQRGWFFDDLVPSQVSKAELKARCREARADLSTRIEYHKPSIIVCILLGIRDHVEVATLMAKSDA
jgi:hypothetical protein